MAALPILWAGVFIASLLVLIKASDYFTDSAEKIGIFFGIPPFIVGVTIIAVGTSLPELVSSIVAVLKGSSMIVVGDVVGSNITNICLIIGVAAVVGKELDVTYDLMSVDLPLLVSSAFFLAVTLWDGSFTVLEAFLCIAGFALYLLYAINVKRKHEDSETEEGNAAGAEKRRLSHKI